MFPFQLNWEEDKIVDDDEEQNANEYVKVDHRNFLKHIVYYLTFYYFHKLY